MDEWSHKAGQGMKKLETAKVGEICKKVQRSRLQRYMGKC